VNEDQVPEDILRALRDAEERLEWARPYVEQARQAAEMTESMRSALRQAQEYVDRTRDAVEMLQPFMPMIRAMREYQELARRILPTSGPLAAWVEQISLATDIGMAQLAGFTRAPMPRQHTAEAHLTLTPRIIAFAEVATGTDSLTVSVEEEAPVEEQERRAIDLVALLVVMVWLSALAMPAAQELLPQEARDYLNGLYATVGLALITTWRINDKRKH
jgi:hypothetical protein